MTRPEFTYKDARKDADRVIMALEKEVGDHAGLAHIWQFVGLFEFWIGQCGRADAAYERSRSRTGARLNPGSRGALTTAWLSAARTRPTACRRLADQAQYVAIKAGRSVVFYREPARASIEHGPSLRDAGTHPRARPASFTSPFLAASRETSSVWRATNLPQSASTARGYDTSVQLGETGYRSTTACDLGEAVYAQGRYDEALRLSEEGEELGAPDDVVTQWRWRALRARLLARCGRVDEAEQLARDALGVISATDYLNDIADMHFGLAEVLELAEKRGEARTSFEDAVRLYTQKGNVVSAARARAVSRARVRAGRRASRAGGSGARPAATSTAAGRGTAL